MTVQSAKRKPCSWEELSTHSREDDCWVAVDGKVYDVTSWIPKHPGGANLIMLCAGRDVTNLFESYHIMSDMPAEILKKYYICEVATTELPKYTAKSPFYDVLRKRVVKHFKDNKKDPQNSWQMWTRYACIYAAFFIMYYITHFGPFTSMFSAVILALAFGFAEAMFSMHILHDASHSSATHKPFWWRFMGATFDLFIGASFFSWNHQHVIGHHLYTNVRGADPDIGENEVDFRRVSPAQEWRWFYKYQHIYAPILYGLLGFKYRTQDWESFVLRMNGPIRVLTPSTFDVVMWLAGKVSFLTMRLVLPLFFMPLGRLMVILFIAEFTLGYYLAFVFQVSHVAHGLEFLATPPSPATAAKIDEDWAILQVRTTQDYAHGDFATTILTGALNYQTVHHLFPTISQGYYAEIAPIVLQTCKEFGIHFQVLPNFWTAFCSHLSYLKFMGQEPEGLQSEMDAKKQGLQAETDAKRGKSKVA